MAAFYSYSMVVHFYRLIIEIKWGRGCLSFDTQLDLAAVLFNRPSKRPLKVNKLIPASCLVLANPHRYICEIIPMIIVYMSNPFQTLLTTIID